MDLLKSRLLPVIAFFASVLFLYFRTPSSKQSFDSDCSILAHDHFWIVSNRVVTPHGVTPGAVEVKAGRINTVKEGEYSQLVLQNEHVLNYGDAVVMPGLIDVHAHLDEPGREEWEGFSTGTKAAAAGGITTLIDMPLNSFPSTISEETLKLKIEAAKKKLYVDVGFWGGLVPENAFDASALDKLLMAGALGLKSFMCPSGINDFPMTNSTHIKEGLKVLAKYKRPLLVHSEVVLESESNIELSSDESDPRSYTTYLKTRPPSWEEAAIRELKDASEETRVGGNAEGAHLHIVHLADSRTSLDLIKEAKSGGSSLTVETCPHYLAFSAEEIPDGDTRFKCAPPIRDEANRQSLWEALLFVLPITWSYGKAYGITLNQLATWWSERPARLAGQAKKGAIRSEMAADLVVWMPDVEFELDENYDIHHKHRNISAYLGKRLSGKVLATFVRGNLVYSEGKHASAACGALILAKQ